MWNGVESDVCIRTLKWCNVISTAEQKQLKKEEKKSVFSVHLNILKKKRFFQKSFFAETRMVQFFDKFADFASVDEYHGFQTCEVAFWTK